MSTVCALFYKTAGIETGGTNALTGLRSGGTLVEPAAWVSSTSYGVGIMVSYSGHAYACNTANSDASWTSGNWDDLGACSPLPITEVDVVYTAYFLALDSVTLSDPGEDSDANVTFDPSSNLQVCATYNGSFTGSGLDVGVKCIGGFQPVYLKLTQLEVSSPDTVSSSQLTWEAGTRCAQVGTVTPTTGNSSVTLAWDDIALGTGGVYEVLRTTANDLTTNPVSLTTSLADGSTGYVNNAANGNAPVNGTTYYYHVRGVDNRGVGAWATAVSATPMATLFADDFNRADSTSLGSDWVEHTTSEGGVTVPDWAIASNQLTTGTAGTAAKAFRLTLAEAAMPVATTDQIVSVMAVNDAAVTTCRAQVFARHSGGTDDIPTGTQTFYMAQLVSSSPDRIYIQKFVGSNTTAINNYTSVDVGAGFTWVSAYVTGWTIAAGDGLKLSCVGTSIQVYVKHAADETWTLAIDIVDNEANRITAGQAGLGAYGASGYTTAMVYDDFLVEVS